MHFFLSNVLENEYHKPFRLVGEQPLVFISYNAPPTRHSNCNLEFGLLHQSHHKFNCIL